MATIRSGRHGHLPRITMNSDGRPHPLMNAIAVFVLIIGLAAFAFGITIVNISSPGLSLAIPASTLGLGSLLIGLYAQMMSATREERMLIVLGIITGFVGLAIGLAHGGLGG